MSFIARFPLRSWSMSSTVFSLLLNDEDAKKKTIKTCPHFRSSMAKKSWSQTNFAKPRKASFYMAILFYVWQVQKRSLIVDKLGFLWERHQERNWPRKQDDLHKSDRSVSNDWPHTWLLKCTLSRDKSTFNKDVYDNIERNI